MKLYRCEHCNSILEEDEIHTEWGETQYVSYCPYCNYPDAFEEGKECVCEEFIEEDEYLCKKCQKRVIEDYRRLMKENFTEEEIEFLEMASITMN